MALVVIKETTHKRLRVLAANVGGTMLDHADNAINEYCNKVERDDKKKNQKK